MKLSTTPRRATRRAAFTLLEVLVVVAIIVILATVASVAVMKNLDDARKNKAQLQAKTIANACEQYFLNPQSNNQYPAQLSELQSPTWGGAPFLPDPARDLNDPWGNQFQYTLRAIDASQQLKPVVSTTAPDGTHIDNYGVGNQSLAGRGQ